MCSTGEESLCNRKLLQTENRCNELTPGITAIVGLAHNSYGERSLYLRMISSFLPQLEGISACSINLLLWQMLFR